jgi:hypothetical protein
MVARVEHQLRVSVTQAQEEVWNVTVLRPPCPETATDITEDACRMNAPEDTTNFDGKACAYYLFCFALRYEMKQKG